MRTQLVDNLIRLVAADARVGGASPAFPRLTADNRRAVGESENFRKVMTRRGRCRCRPATGGSRPVGALSARARAGQKERAPAMPEPHPLTRCQIRPDRRHFACRRRPETSRTNPFQISCRHCPRRTVNGAYTLIGKVNRVLTINIAASLAAMPCGFAGVPKGWR